MMRAISFQKVVAQWKRNNCFVNRKADSPGIGECFSEPGNPVIVNTVYRPVGMPFRKNSIPGNSYLLCGSTEMQCSEQNNQ